MSAFRFCVLIFGLCCWPTVVMAAPDEEPLGKAKGYPVGTWDNWFFDESARVGTFSNFHQLRPYNVLPKAEKPLQLSQTPVEPTLEYRYQGKKYGIDDYLAHQRVSGLLILRDGEVLLERYQYGRQPSDRFLSKSIAKSLVSLAVGLALAEKRFISLDDRVSAYVPALKNNAYGETSLRNLLRMSSGVRFGEKYQPGDDLFRFQDQLLADGSLSAILAFSEREARQGSRFSYASIETHVLALALRAATGMTLAEYLAPRLWQAMGAESDAFWSKGPDGLELAYGYFNATLRDYGRLGALLANDGERDDASAGRQVIPKAYLLEATDWKKHPAILAPGRKNSGYGYQFWTMPGAKRRFAMFGVYGQAIFVDPETKLVLVHMAVAKNASVSRDSMGEELVALWSGLLAKYAKHAVLDVTDGELATEVMSPWLSAPIELL